MTQSYKELGKNEICLVKNGLLAFLVLCGLLLPLSSHADPLVIVFGLDETGSYDFRKKAISLANGIIAGLEPGDILYARRVTEKSYEDSCAIFRLEVPQVGEPPKNKFDRRALVDWKKATKRAAAAKSQAIGILSRLAPVKAPMTDIWGFLAAAGDRLRAETSKKCLKMIVIASDMKDNCRRKTSMDLQGAEISIIGFETGGDPGAAQKLQAEWSEGLKKCNASSVCFIPVDCKVALNR